MKVNLFLGFERLVRILPLVSVYTLKGFIPLIRKGFINPEIESLHLEPKTRQTIAAEYGISVNTLKSKLKEAKIILPPGIVMPPTQKQIYYALGIPKYMNIKVRKKDHPVGEN